MKEKLKKGLAIGLSALSFALVGCGDGGKGKTPTEIDFDKQASLNGVPTYQSEEKIKLGGWFSPDAKDELWQWYKESGLNEVTVFPSNRHTEEYLMSALQYSRQHELDAVMLMNGAIKPFATSQKDWVELLKDYGDVVTGFDLYDEPVMDRQLAVPSYGVNGRTCFADLVPVVEYVTKNFPNAEMFSTLFPNYATNPQLGIANEQTYEDYVKGYCDTVLSVFPEGAKKWIGTDFYPYYTNRFDYGLLSNLEVLQKYAQEEDASVFLYIQTMDSQKLNWRLPSYEELSLQYYAALAYGVENIQMFCFQQPGNGHGFGAADGQAMVTDGYVYEGVYERTQVYYDVQTLNGHVSVLEKAYMDFDWQGVIVREGTDNTATDVFTKLKYDMSSYEGIKSCKSTENLIVGCFKDGDGNDGYMITNYSDPNNMKEGTVDIDFGDKSRAIVYKDGAKYVVNLIDGHYKTTMAKGTGHFVIPVE